MTDADVAELIPFRVRLSQLRPTSRPIRVIWSVRDSETECGTLVCEIQTSIMGWS